MSVAIADDEPIASISYEFLFSGALFLSAVAGATPRAYRMKIANGLQIPCKVPASTLPFADLCVAQLGHLSGDIADDELIIGRFSVASAAETPSCYRPLLRVARQSPLPTRDRPAIPTLWRSVRRTGSLGMPSKKITLEEGHPTSRKLGHLRRRNKQARPTASYARSRGRALEGARSSI